MVFAFLLAVLSLKPSPILSIPTAEAASISYSTTTLEAFASSTAADYGLDRAHFLAVISCESGWNPDAIGDHGTSIGIAQLHFPPQEWGVSTSTALDPYAAIGIMAQAWAKGEQTKWSCWRDLFGA